MFEFKLLKNSQNLRLGKITTSHGDIMTPVFMPVGTAGSLKALTSAQIVETNSQIILANTYHLYLRPGTKVLEKFKGIHNFMNWQKPILTDSGGFQVLSLSKGLVKTTEDGVEFRSFIDGSKHFFTPERVMQIEKSIGADIIMAFDQISKDDNDDKSAKDSMERTLRWLDRCINEKEKIDPENLQALFGILQGGNNKDIRIESAKRTAEKELPGNAIGGESIGYNKQMTKEILEWVIPYLPENKPRYAMGVGDIDDIFEIVERGVDMFDCVSPTRIARNGALLISPEENGTKENKYRLNITKTEFELSDSPIDITCECHTCKNYSRGYIHHLFRSKELLANTLASIHNVAMLANITKMIRESIETNTFHELKSKWIN